MRVLNLNVNSVMFYKNHKLFVKNEWKRTLQQLKWEYGAEGTFWGKKLSKVKTILIRLLSYKLKEDLTYPWARKQITKEQETVGNF